MPRTVTEWFMIILMIVALLCGFLGQSFITSLLAITLTGFVVIIGIIAYEEIPADPHPSVAMPTFLGRRYDVLIREGWVFVFTYIEDLIIENIEPEELLLVFDNVSCNLEHKDGKPVPGGLVSVEVSVMYIPDHDDPERFRMFLNKGRRKKINSMLESKLGELVRHQGKEMTWEEFIFAKSSLSVEFITSLTGLQPPDINDDAAVKEFLETALVSGVEDVKDLGIKFHRINVTEVEPSGKLKQRMDEAASELLQRKAEQTDIGTSLKLAMELLAGMGISEGDLKAMPLKERERLVDKTLELVRIERGRATENIVRSSGNPFADAAAMMNNPAAKKSSEAETGNAPKSPTEDRPPEGDPEA